MPRGVRQRRVGHELTHAAGRRGGARGHVPGEGGGAGRVQRARRGGGRRGGGRRAPPQAPRRPAARQRAPGNDAGPRPAHSLPLPVFLVLALFPVAFKLYLITSPVTIIVTYETYKIQ